MAQQSLRSPSQYLDNNGKRFVPSINPTPGFNAAADTEKLSRSMRCWGTDENAIINILGRRTSSERQQIVEAYRLKCKRELASDLSGDLSGHFRDLAMLLTESPIYLMAKSLYYAMRGAGTNENTLIEILVSCTTDELKKLKEAYVHVLRDKGIKDPKRTLESDIRAETKSYFCKGLLKILQAEGVEPTAEQLRILEKNGSSGLIDVKKAQADAKRLAAIKQKPKNTYENEYLMVLCGQNVWQIAAIANEFQKVAQKTLLNFIKETIEGEFAILMSALVEHALDRPKFFSDLLFNSMVGAGTRDFLLMRVMILRSEIDLRTIENTYDRDHKSLANDIKGDTSGDYEKLLLTLLGGPQA